MTARTLTASRALLGATLPFAVPIGLVGVPAVLGRATRRPARAPDVRRRAGRVGDRARLLPGGPAARLPVRARLGHAARAAGRPSTSGWPSRPAPGSWSSRRTADISPADEPAGLARRPRILGSWWAAGVRPHDDDATRLRLVRPLAGHEAIRTGCTPCRTAARFWPCSPTRSSSAPARPRRPAGGVGGRVRRARALLAVAATLACRRIARRARRAARPHDRRWVGTTAAARRAAASRRADRPPSPSAGGAARWILLAAVPSGLLAAVTTFIATDLDLGAAPVGRSAGALPRLVHRRVLGPWPAPRTARASPSPRPR